MELRCKSATSHLDDSKGTGMERMLLEMIRSELGDVPVDAENLDGRLNDARLPLGFNRGLIPNSQESIYKISLDWLVLYLVR
jgi:hypothetical protein